MNSERYWSFDGAFDCTSSNFKSSSFRVLYPTEQMLSSFTATTCKGSSIVGASAGVGEWVRGRRGGLLEGVGDGGGGVDPGG